MAELVPSSTWQLSGGWEADKSGIPEGRSKCQNRKLTLVGNIDFPNGPCYPLTLFAVPPTTSAKANLQAPIDRCNTVLSMLLN